MSGILKWIRSVFLDTCVVGVCVVCVVRVCGCVCVRNWVRGERQCACVSVVVTSHRTYHVMSIGELWQVCSISPILLTTQWLCGRNIQWGSGECSVYSLRSRSEAAGQLAESWTQCASPQTQGHSLHWPCAAAVLNTTACSDSCHGVCHPTVLSYNVKHTYISSYPGLPT